MSCRLIALPHPFKADRIEKLIEPQAISKIVSDLRYDRIPAAARVMINDEPISEQDWGRLPVDGDLVIIRMVPVGGDDPGAKAVDAVAFIAGTMLGWSPLGILLRIPLGFRVYKYVESVFAQPEFDFRDPERLPEIRGGRNRANQWGKIAVVLGRRYVTPNYGAAPYTEIVGDDQYLRQLFVVGYGPLDITEIRIGETLITEFSDVEYEILDSSATSTLYPSTVFQEDIGTELLSGVPLVRTTASDTDEIQVDILLPNGLIEYQDDGDKVSKSVSISCYYKPTGDPDTSYQLFGIDGVAAPISITSKTTKTIRKVASVKTTRGQYDVKIVRDTADHPASSVVDNTYAGAIRSFTNDEPISPDVLPDIVRIAVRIRASQQLNGVIETLNCVAQAKVQNYDGIGTGPSAWTTVEATRNPAAMFLYKLRGKPNPKPAPDSMIDWPSIEAWHTWCETNGIECNEVLGGGSPLGTVLQKIAQTGRASFTMRDGKYSIANDVKKTTPVQLFTPRNSFGFTANRGFPDIPHALKIGFVNEAVGYQQDECVVYDDGYSVANATKFETIDVWGVTSYDQAWKAGRYILATMKLRPETYILNVDIEYLVSNVGDLVRVVHDVPLFGISAGRIKQLTDDGLGNVTAITADELFEMEAGKTYGIRIRHQDGTQSVHAATTVPGASNPLQLATPIPAGSTPMTGNLYAFGEHELETVEMIITTIEPANDLHAKLTLVDAAPGVHQADQGTIPPFDSQITLPAELSTVPPAAPVLSDVRSDGTVMVKNADGSWEYRIVMTPTISSGLRLFDHYEVEYRVNGSDEPYTRLPDIAASASQLIVPGVEEQETYDIRVRVVTGELLASAWTAIIHTVAGKIAPPQDVLTLTAVVREGGIEIKWTAVADRDLSHYEVRVGVDWASGAEIFAGLAQSYLWDIQTAATYHLMVKAVDSSLNTSVTEASYDAVIAAPGVPQNLTAQIVDNLVIVGWNAPATGSLPVREYEILKGVDIGSAVLLASIAGTAYTITEADIGANTYWIRAVDIAGNVGTEDSINASVTSIPVSGSEVTPLDVSLAADGVYKAIVLTMDAQPNLVDFSHFEVQVSADEVAWYPLAFDLTDWKTGIVGEWTSWNATILVHPVPHAGTVDAPVGRLLYYRARRVTKSAAVSDWTAPISNASAQSKVIDSGDLAADSIIANKILAGSIDASKLSVDILQALVAQITDRIEITADGIIGETADGSRRIIIENDRLHVDVWNGATWDVALQVGGDNLLGQFLPWFYGNGLVDKEVDIAGISFGLARPAGILVYDFTTDYLDHIGIDPWTKLNVRLAAEAGVFGGLSLAANAADGSLVQTPAGMTINGAWSVGTWIKAGAGTEEYAVFKVGGFRALAFVGFSISLLSCRWDSSDVNSQPPSEVETTIDIPGTSGLLSTPTTAYMSSIETDKAGVWIIAGGSSHIFRSLDNGSTWGTLLSNPGGGVGINDIATDEAGVWVAVGDSGVLFRSANNGLSWGSLITTPTIDYISAVATDKAGVWIAAGRDYSIFRSIDNGLTWGPIIVSSPGGAIYSLATDGGGVWIAVGGSGHLIRSSDNGASWGSLIATPVSDSIRDVATDGNGVWVAVGLAGKLFRSIDNGVSWGSLIATPTANNLESITTDGNGVWAVTGDGGHVFTSIDNGASWGPLVTTPTSNNLTGIATDGLDVWVTAGQGGIAFGYFNDLDYVLSLLDAWNATYSAYDEITVTALSTGQRPTPTSPELTVTTINQGSPDRLALLVDGGDYEVHARLFPDALRIVAFDYLYGSGAGRYLAHELPRRPADYSMVHIGSDGAGSLWYRVDGNEYTMDISSLAFPANAAMLGLYLSANIDPRFSQTWLSATAELAHADIVEYQQAFLPWADADARDTRIQAKPGRNVNHITNNGGRHQFEGPVEMLNGLTVFGGEAESVIASAFDGTDGYIHYSSGLIMQWGYKLDTGGTMTISYPIAFTTRVFSVQCQMVRNTVNYQNTVVATDYAASLSSVVVRWDSAADGISWFAIGV